MKLFGISVLAGFVLCIAAVTEVRAEVKVAVDTPWSFRATFTAVDTDPASIAGNDYRELTFDYWSVLFNMRGDAVVDGKLNGFYEIQLRRTGHKALNPDAPVVNTHLFYSGLEPDLVLTDTGVSAQSNAEGGSDFLSHTVYILFDQANGVVRFSGTIAGDVDLTGDGEVDVPTTDKVVETLRDLKDVGIITGQEMGQIIRQTRQPVKK
jgi:hypothetical protein